MGLVDKEEFSVNNDVSDFSKIVDDVSRKKEAYENEIRKAIAFRRRIAASETPDTRLLTKLDELIQKANVHPTPEVINTEMDQREAAQAARKEERAKKIAAREAAGNPQPEEPEESEEQ